MIRSKKYLAGSRDQPCTFRIPGHCNNDWSTVVPCHIRDGNTGAAQKASDLSVANGCAGCHRAFDLNLISHEDWLFYALRGLQETLQQRFEAGLLVIPVDAPKADRERPKAKSETRRVPKRKIVSRGFSKSHRKFGQ